MRASLSKRLLLFPLIMAVVMGFLGLSVRVTGAKAGYQSVAMQ